MTFRTFLKYNFDIFKIFENQYLLLLVYWSSNYGIFSPNFIKEQFNKHF